MISSNFSNCLTANVEIRVPFFDLDPANVVWHGRYFQYFELARCELLESVGYSYDGMQASGLLWPVADSIVRYVRPLTLNQAISVTACLRETRPGLQNRRRKRGYPDASQDHPGPGRCRDSGTDSWRTAITARQRRRETG